MRQHTYNIKPKERHKRVARKMAENGGNSLGKVLESEGYSKNTQKSPGKVTRTKGFQIAQRDILKELEAEEKAVLAEMKIKRSKANYGTLAMSRKYVREQAWQAEDRLKAGGPPPEKIEIELTIK